MPHNLPHRLPQRSQKEQTRPQGAHPPPGQKGTTMNTEPAGIVLKQYYLGCLAHASYLIADEASATAIVVDPQRDIQQYIDDANSLCVHIRHIFLTPFHADLL